MEDKEFPCGNGLWTVHCEKENMGIRIEQNSRGIFFIGLDFILLK
jgi:hypothetical protein